MVALSVLISVLMLFDGMSGTQTPIDGALRLRHVWGVWENDLARIDFGRMRHHWGLGLMANGGACLDCDFLEIALTEFR